VQAKADPLISAIAFKTSVAKTSSWISRLELAEIGFITVVVIIALLLLGVGIHCCKKKKWAAKRESRELK